MDLRAKWHDWVLSMRLQSQIRVKVHSELKVQQVTEDKQMQLEALKLMLRRKQAKLIAIQRPSLSRGTRDYLERVYT